MKKKGFTLIEIILFIVVFTVGVTGIMTIFYNTVSRTADPLLRDKAIQVAQSVMDEIYGKKWDELTPNGGDNISVGTATIGAEETNIDDYDDVDDYNGLDCTTCDSNCFTDITCNYNVKVSVNFVSIDSSGNIVDNSSNTNYKKIVVQVTSDALNETYKITAIKANF